MNVWTGIGRLTADPECSRTGTGKPVAKYKLAVDRKYKRDGQPNADFIPCVAFGNDADFASTYFHKGMKIAVRGRIQTRSYDDRDGKKVYVTEIAIEDQEFCESKKEKESSGSSVDDLKQFPGVQWKDEPISDEESLPF